MTFRIALTPAARRDLASLPHEVARRIDTHILALAENPFPPKVKKLQGSPGFLRIRVGDYRIVYTVQHKHLIVLVIKIGHRREVYRG